MLAIRFRADRTTDVSIEVATDVSTDVSTDSTRNRMADRALVASAKQPTRADIRVVTERDPQLMARLQQRSMSEIQRRFDDGHRAYVAIRDGEIAAWGWVATRRATIGELATTLVLPDRCRYLWNFVTLPEHRGHGVYPHLINEILEREVDANTFLIAYAPENHASAKGIRKAGFHPVAELSFDLHGRPALRALRGEARALARHFSLPLAHTPLTPCWKCVRAGRAAMSCTAATCRCDYQRADQSCAETTGIAISNGGAIS